MTLSTFAFIFAVVLLNACAQLLLKSGVNNVGAITIDRASKAGVPLPQALRSRLEAYAAAHPHKPEDKA